MPLVDDLYAQLDNNFKESCNVRIRDIDKLRGKAEEYYLKKRKILYQLEEHNKNLLLRE